MSYTNRVIDNFNNVTQAFNESFGSNSRSTSFMAKDINNQLFSSSISKVNEVSSKEQLSFEDKVVEKFIKIQSQFDKIKNISDPVEKRKSLKQIEEKIRNLVSHIPEHIDGIPDRITMQFSSEKSKKYEQKFSELAKGIKSSSSIPNTPKNKY